MTGVQTCALPICFPVTIEASIVLVSSGAVGTGKKYIKNYAGKIEERKAAAAIGNPILIYKYSEAFLKYKIKFSITLDKLLKKCKNRYWFSK